MAANGDIDSRFTIKLARSLDEALHMAREIDPLDKEGNRGTFPTESPSDGTDGCIGNSTRSLQCWVAGGERLYAEALNHSSATEVHLSVVDIVIDTSAFKDRQIARFPAKYRWDNKYTKVSETTFAPILSDDGTTLEPSFTHFGYMRVVHQRENCLPCGR